MRHYLTTCFILIWLLTGCTVQVPDIYKETFKCNSDDDCAKEFHCNNNICVPNDSSMVSNDTLAPDTQITSSPTNPSGTSVEFKYTGTDNDSVIGFDCSLDDASFSPCGVPNSGQASIQYNDLSTGSHTFQVRARDNSGNVDNNPASYTWQVQIDTSGSSSGFEYPSTTITSAYPDTAQTTQKDINFYFSASSNYGIANFECELDNSGYSVCSNINPGSFSYSSLSYGEHVFRVRAKDNNGNYDPQPPEYRWNIVTTITDSQSPETYLNSTPASSSTNTYAYFSFSGSDNIQVTGFDCRLDSEPFAPCGDGSSNSIDYYSLQPGTHYFAVRAIDSSNNVDNSPSTFTWYVASADTTPPITYINSSPSSLTNDSYANFTFSCNETNCTYECRLDYGAYFDCSGGSISQYVDEGSHTFEVWAFDSSNNRDDYGATYYWDVDTVQPTLSLTFYPSAPTTPDSRTSFNVDLDCSDYNGCTITYKFDSENVTTATNYPENVSRYGLTETSHTLTVWATDSAGNTTEDTRTWTVSMVWQFVDSGPSAQHNCAIASDQSLWCFGANKNGQVAPDLGDERIGWVTRIHSETADGVDNWLQATAGGGHTCGLRYANGGAYQDLWCWGANSDGQLGLGYTGSIPTEPMQVADYSYNFVKVKAGTRHTCALTSNKTLYCWGNNSYGQLGLGNTSDYESNFTNIVSGGYQWQDFALGDDFTCGIQNDYSLWCWGKNDYGQLGIGNNQYKSQPTLVDNTMQYRNVVVGQKHACALDTGDKLYCWGDNSWLQVGPSSSLYPLYLSDNWSGMIFAGANHTCAIRNNNLECWGGNYNGQLGVGHTYSQGPSAVLNGATTAALGAVHTCAINSYGLYCWGNRNEGTVGNGIAATLAPTDKVLNTSYGYIELTSLSTGGKHACGRDLYGKAWCWGDDRFGQLGNEWPTPATEFIDDIAPRQEAVGLFSGSNAINKVTAGAKHSCFIINGGELYCSGDNSIGQLGTGTYNSRAVPEREYYYSSDWIAVGAGSEHTCGIRSISGSNSVYCWGQNNDGQLGNNQSDNFYNTPQIMVQNGTSFDDWTQLAVGDQHSCAIRHDYTYGYNELYCWGKNANGQIGIDSNSPTKILMPTNTWSGQTQWLTASAGGNHTCGITGSAFPGSLRCWGSNSLGQLGNGTFTDVYSPVSSTSLGNNWIWVAAGLNHTCGIQYASAGKGSLWCWGANHSGQLGAGYQFYQSATPVQVGAKTDWVAVAAGDNFTCGIRANGAVYEAYCFGDNYQGQLGNATAWEVYP
ncbi:MAG: hypothetical protein JW841_07050 [Deltaproteobacteria bacterium]|nr:hypothetical protein [Deltaproteobacteria bacterium]